MNILVVFTGGTIGSTVKDGWISTDSETKYQLIELYKKRYGGTGINFDKKTPYYILSENLSAAELTKLGKCINENLDNGYDGIIVTHGTDTLQYSASALSFMFSDVEIPIVLVSSAYPLENEKANGVDNFNGAVEFIKSGMGTGVYVSYKNSFENKVNIHTGTRLIAHMEASSEVFSVDNNPYAFYDNGKINLNNEYISGKVSDKINPVEFCDYPKILVVDCHPGDEFNYKPENYNAIILVPYHSATLNTQNDKFKKFMDEAKQNEVPVFLVNVPSGEQYETTKIYKELNINVLPMCSKPAIYVKCWIALSLGKNIKEFVNSSVAQEFIEKGDIK